MRSPAARLIIVLAASLVAACGEYARADWPDLTEGFEYTPTEPQTAPGTPEAPPVRLAPAQITRILAEGRSGLQASRTEIIALFEDFESVLGGLESAPEDAAGRAWLSAQLALSRVSQAADGLSLLRADLRRAEAQTDSDGSELRALLAEVEAYRAEIDQRLVAERDRLDQRRPD